MERGQLGYYIYYLLQYSPIIPFVFGIIHYRELSRPVRIFFAYITMTLGLTVVMAILFRFKMNNLWVMNLSFPIYAWLILRMYAMWEKQRRARIAIWICFLVFLAVWLIEMVFFNRLRSFTVVASPMRDIIFILIACYAIYEANKDMLAPITELPIFWISAGVILYHGGVLLLDLVSAVLLVKSVATLKLVLLIQALVSFPAFLLYIGAFRCHYPVQIPSGLSSSVQPSY